MNPPDFLSPTAQAWYMAARPRSLTATYAPLLVGAAVAIADHVFDLPRFLLAFIGALLLQIAANLVNEYVDYTRGTDAKKTDGMGMVLSRSEVLTPQQVRLGAIVTVLGGALIGLLLVAGSGPLLLWIGLGGVFVVIFYTAGPLPLAYIGLGEIAVFIFMGPLMTLGTYYAISGGHVSRAALLTGLPIAFTVANILHANNMRDLEADRLANKHTLAGYFGMQGSKQEFAGLVYGAYAATLILVLLKVIPWTTLVIVFTLPQAVRLVEATFAANEPPQFHRIQGRMAQLHFRLGLALALGWLIYWLAVPTYWNGPLF
ncbi:MAG: 1,4-dihydroxy-2-naphthoate octaprenyltransferase [Chloroflexota bacterium]